ncbi:MAG: CHAT domain-containing protein [Planctomycetota bacterium]|nr:CHAT domain-containing protein [Planctomycetota bacterium]
MSVDDERIDALLKSAREEVASVDPWARPRAKADVDRLEAVLLFNRHNWELARRAYETAIDSSIAAGAENFALVTDLAQLELLLERPATALAHLRRTIDNGYELEASGWDAIVWSGIAIDVYAACGLYDLAFAHLKALEKRTASGSLEDHVDLAFRRIGLELRTERYERAIATAEEMLARTGVTIADRNEMLVSLGLARSETARGRADDGGAGRTLEEALASGVLHIDDALDAELILLDLALRAHDHELARTRLSALDARFRKIDETTSGANHPRRRCLRAAYAARLALDASARPDNTGELRARRDELVAAIEVVWQGWECGAGRAGGIGFLSLGTERMIISEALRLEMALEPGERGIENALSVLLRAQRPGSLSRSLGETALELSDVRAAGCRDGTTLLIFLPAMDRSHVFQLDATRVSHFQPPSRDDLVAAVHRLGLITLRPPGPSVDQDQRLRNFDRAANDLTDLLFDEAGRERACRWKSLTVVGAELLSNVSIEFVRPDRLREIGLAVPVAYVSSMPLLVALERRAASRASEPFSYDLVVVTDPRPDPSNSSVPRQLELTGEEHERLRAGFSSERVLALDGAAATLEHVTSDRVLRAGVLAIVAHGSLDSASEIQAGIPLASGVGASNLLDADVIARLERTPRFVELLCCRAGSGPLRMGDDAATHLGTAFLAAGSDVVLASRGDLSVSASIDTAHVLHSALASGASASEALRRARCALIENPATADPFFRALLRIEGLGHRAVFSAGATPKSNTDEKSAFTRNLLLAGAAVAIAASLSIVFARRSENLAR